MALYRRWHSIIGFLFGLFISWLLFGENNEKNNSKWTSLNKNIEGGIQLAENWERIILEQKHDETGQNKQPKLNRPRFASTELCIKQNLLIFLLVRTSTASSLYSFLSQYVPVKILILNNQFSINDMPLNSQPIYVRSDPVSLFNAIANISLNNAANWYLLLSDSTFLNIYELERIIKILWNIPIAIGWNNNEIIKNKNIVDTEDGGGGHCLLEAGILLSSPAMNTLLQGRHLCNGLSFGHGGEDSSLETCIRLAGNLSCVTSYQGFKHFWWKMSSDNQQSLSPSIHDQIEHLSLLPDFNQSLTISPLLSELDVFALIKHFLNVELTRTEESIKLIENELLKNYSLEETGWPVGINDIIKPLNRFQVPVWELITSNWKKFSNNPEVNWSELNKDELLEWTEVFNEAIKSSSKCFKNEAIFHEGYKRYNPDRGVDYLIDLKCNNKQLIERIQITRPINSLKLLEKVPYVKEDREIALLVPVETPSQIYGLHPLLRKILSICISGAVEGRQLKVLIAARNVEALPLRLLGENLTEMRKRCRSIESSLLLIKPDPTNQIAIELAALDEAVDHFGQSSLFLLLSPFADFQSEFLDRVRLNTIQYFQIYFPIAFIEFNQIVTGITPKELELFIIHKNRGRFDSNYEWNIAGLYGADYVSARIKHPNALKLSSLFLNQSNIHIFRAVEPSLRIRPHLRVCPLNKFHSIEEKKRCESQRRLALGTRAQLAKLFILAITPSNGVQFN